MHGKTFEVGRLQTLLEFPDFGDLLKQIIMDMDARTKTPMTTIITEEDKYYGIIWVPVYRTWVIFRMKFLYYKELEDIRKAYLHGNKYHA